MNLFRRITDKTVYHFLSFFAVNVKLYGPLADKSSNVNTVQVAPVWICPLHFPVRTNMLNMLNPQ